MFTGIVQGVAQIQAIKKSDHFRTQTIKLPPAMRQGLQVGASIANNGVCLTVTQIDGDLVSFDIMQETLRITNLGSLEVGDFVNIERAMQMGVFSPVMFIAPQVFHILLKLKIIVRFGLNCRIKM